MRVVERVTVRALQLRDAKASILHGLCCLTLLCSALVCVSRFPSSTLLPFFLGVPLLKPNSRKKGTLIIKGLLGNLGVCGWLCMVLVRRL